MMGVFLVLILMALSLFSASALTKNCSRLAVLSLSSTFLRSLALSPSSCDWRASFIITNLLSELSPGLDLDFELPLGDADLSFPFGLSGLNVPFGPPPNRR